MPEPARPPRRALAAGAAGPTLPLLQGAILLVAVLYFARELLIPLALAVLLAFVLAPLVRALRRIAVPRIAAVLLVVLATGALFIGLGTVVGSQATSLAENLPSYQTTISQKLAGLGGWFERLQGLVAEVSRQAAPHGPAAAPAGRPIPVELHSPDPTPFDMLRSVAEPLLGPLATAGIVVILLIFILLYREDLRDRLIRLAGAGDLHRTMAAMDDAAWRLSRFFLAQTAMNAGFGVVIGLALWGIGIPNPLLWGVVAAVMRFVPFIGTFVAVAGPLLLALAVDPGWGMLIAVAILFGVGEATMGQVFEPLVFGHSTGLSPIAVIAAASFWTWLWGPVGLLLAVPLTVCLVVLGRHVDRLEFLEVMLGDAPPLDPEETFYQRALAGDADALAEQAERCLREDKLAGYLDAVALPALVLAQEDVARGALAPERRAALTRSLGLLAEDLAEAEEDEERAPPPLPPGWEAPGTVLCLPGRGPFDAEAAMLLALLLTRRGFGVRLGGEVAEGVRPRLVCLCLMEGGGSAAAARYLLRRARRRLPGVPCLVLAWSAAGPGVLDAALRAESGAPPLLAHRLTELLERAAELAGPAPAEGEAEAPAAAEGPPGMAPAPA
ncbi:AI-2E family transporter [Siccirubricoccus sp. KC 17139]|uniref:AI-2E family transporter n=1 Tax=Siccirubricoccus soli TaxID=2899147 RepID=A0ABT1DDA7_9PROT|nr:AI-2E family transporter [Siccirubricoccus soli]MCO6419582.1 AI-2E family transporter [Siccirubricoccus soli]MCP2685717.1 AI-2E family transporter [Siccirubricoccus soli]